MKACLFFILFFLMGFVMTGQTVTYYRIAPIINGEVQTTRFNQKVIVRMNRSDYYDLEITLDHKEEEKKIITRIHLDPGSQSKKKTGSRMLISQYGNTQSGDLIRIIYPTDKSSFWLVTEFFTDGRIKAGAIYEK